jgi:hypothetical protein
MVTNAFFPQNMTKTFACFRVAKNPLCSSHWGTLNYYYYFFGVFVTTMQKFTLKKRKKERKEKKKKFGAMYKTQVSKINK